MDNPPVNALTVAGWFELADVIRGLGDDPAVRVVVLRAEGRGFNAGVDIKEMQSDRGLRRPDRRQPGLLRRLRRGVRVRGPGDRRGQRLLPRRRHRPGRQRRRHRRRRRRHLRPARGRPRRARRGHPPGPARAAAQDAGDGLHVGHRDGGRAAPLRLGAARSCRRTSCATRRCEVAGADRGEEPDGDPRGQGVAQRHRPDRREAQLPLRAGLHVRAQPVRRGRRSAATPSSRSATPKFTKYSGRQADDRGRGRRRAARRHDDRHRRLGLAAQADVARAGDPALRPART